MSMDVERLRVRVSKLEKEIYSLRITLETLASTLHVPMTTAREGAAMNRASKLLRVGLSFDPEMLPDNEH